MSIESPTTYGEWWWSKQVDANRSLDEEYEHELSPVLAALFEGLGIYEGLDPTVATFLRAIVSPQAPAFAQVGQTLAAGTANGIAGDVLGPVTRPVAYAFNSKWPTNRIDDQTAMALKYKRKILDDMFKSRLRGEGFDEFEAVALYDAFRPYPSVTDFIRMGRYFEVEPQLWKWVQDRIDVSDTEYPVWEFLTKPLLSTRDVQELYRRRLWGFDESWDELYRIGWHENNRENVLAMSYEVPHSQLLLQGWLQQGIDDRQIRADLDIGGIVPEYTETFIDAVLAKPTSADLVAYLRRRNPSMPDLEENLRRVGVHPAYFDLYRTLAYPIPPVADLITMAVREAFSPTIAERFGQYEDYPTELTRYAEGQGISEEWARRYWASHWSLPSPQQGFEMLHRGAINEDELNLLLRALDIMPFWRDKLLAISYNPLTRVDVRRMYALGVLDEESVFKAYRDIGYDEDNAEYMTEFTIRQTLKSQLQFKPNDVLKAYQERVIDRREAERLLTTLFVRDEDIDAMLEGATYEREWDLTKARIAGVRNLYKKGQLNDNQARSRLAILDLPGEEIDVLMEQWYTEPPDDPPPTWTKAETLKFLKTELIDEERARRELSIIGYDTEHIDIYLKSIEE